MESEEGGTKTPADKIDSLADLITEYRNRGLQIYDNVENIPNAEKDRLAASRQEQQSRQQRSRSKLSRRSLNTTVSVGSCRTLSVGDQGSSTSQTAWLNEDCLDAEEFIKQRLRERKKRRRQAKAEGILNQHNGGGEIESRSTGTQTTDLLSTRFLINEASSHISPITSTPAFEADQSGKISSPGLTVDESVHNTLTKQLVNSRTNRSLQTSPVTSTRNSLADISELSHEDVFHQKKEFIETLLQPSDTLVTVSDVSQKIDTTQTLVSKQAPPLEVSLKVLPSDTVIEKTPVSHDSSYIYQNRETKPNPESVTHTQTADTISEKSTEIADETRQKSLNSPSQDKTDSNSLSRKESDINEIMPAKTSKNEYAKRKRTFTKVNRTKKKITGNIRAGDTVEIVNSSGDVECIKVKDGQFTLVLYRKKTNLDDTIPTSRPEDTDHKPLSPAEPRSVSNRSSPSDESHQPTTDKVFSNSDQHYAEESPGTQPPEWLIKNACVFEDDEDSRVEKSVDKKATEGNSSSIGPTIQGARNMASMESNDIDGRQTSTATDRHSVNQETVITGHEPLVNSHASLNSDSKHNISDESMPSVQSLHEGGEGASPKTNTTGSINSDTVHGGENDGDILLNGEEEDAKRVELESSATHSTRHSDVINQENQSLDKTSEDTQYDVSATMSGESGTREQKDTSMKDRKGIPVDNEKPSTSGEQGRKRGHTQQSTPNSLENSGKKSTKEENMAVMLEKLKHGYSEENNSQKEYLQKLRDVRSTLRSEYKKILMKGRDLQEKVEVEIQTEGIEIQTETTEPIKEKPKKKEVTSKIDNRWDPSDPVYAKLKSGSKNSISSEGSTDPKDGKPKTKDATSKINTRWDPSDPVYAKLQSGSKTGMPVEDSNDPKDEKHKTKDATSKINTHWDPSDPVYAKLQPGSKTGMSVEDSYENPKKDVPTKLDTRWDPSDPVYAKLMSGTKNVAVVEDSNDSKEGKPKKAPATSKLSTRWDPSDPVYEKLQSGFKSNQKVAQSREVEDELMRIRHEKFEKSKDLQQSSVYVSEAKRIYPQGFKNADGGSSSPSTKPDRSQSRKDKTQIDKTTVNETVENGVADTEKKTIEPISPKRPSRFRFNKKRTNADEQKKLSPIRNPKPKIAYPQLKKRSKSSDTLDEKLAKDIQTVESYQKYINDKEELPKMYQKQDSSRTSPTKSTDDTIDPTRNMKFNFSTQREKTMYKLERKLSEASGSFPNVDNTSKASSETGGQAESSASRRSGDGDMQRAVDIVQSRRTFFNGNATRDSDLQRHHRVWKLFNELKMMRNFQGSVRSSYSEPVTFEETSGFLLLKSNSEIGHFSQFKSSREHDRFLYDTFNYELCVRSSGLYQSKRRKTKALNVIRHKVNKKEHVSKSLNW